MTIPAYARASTPAYAKLSQSSTTQFLLTEGLRRVLMRELKDQAKVVSPAWILALLPSVPSTEVTQVLNKLKKGRDPLITRSGHWRGIPNDPSKCEENEKELFDALSPIMLAIFEAADKLHPKEGFAAFGYKSDAGIVPDWSMKSTRSRPDAYVHLLGLLDAFYNIVCVAEFKKAMSQKTMADNIRKIVWSIAQVMCDDPRRRLCFGFTIDNTEMRLWYATRSLLLTSTPFNFITDRRTFVSFFMALKYANEYELGWDPTMTRIGRNIFDITVHSASGRSVVFRTSRILSNQRADSLIGSCTRVFKGQELKNGKLSTEYYAIKDVWVESTRLPEGDIHEAIMADMPDEHSREELDKRLLSIVYHGFVHISHAGELVKDDHSFILGPNSFPFDAEKFDLMQDEFVDTHPEPVNFAGRMHGHPPFPSGAVLTRSPSSHYRVVYRQVCRPLDGSTSVDEVCESMEEVCYIISLLQRGGWVHRDVSPWNVLIDEDNMIRLGDMEYAMKSTYEGEAHAIRTASANYMAVEVQNNRYLFRGRAPRHSKNVAKTLLEDYTESSSSGPSLSQSSTAASENERQLKIAKFFQHNALHDYESVWWIGMNTVWWRWPDDDTDDKDRQREQLKVAQILFSDRTTTFFRQDKFAVGTLLHKSMQPFLRSMVKIWDTLQETYDVLERDPDSDFIHMDEELSQSVCHALQRRLRHLRKHLPEDGVKLVSWEEIYAVFEPAVDADVDATIVGDTNGVAEVAGQDHDDGVGSVVEVDEQEPTEASEAIVHVTNEVHNSPDRRRTRRTRQFAVGSPSKGRPVGRTIDSGSPAASQAKKSRAKSKGKKATSKTKGKQRVTKRSDDEQQPGTVESDAAAAQTQTGRGSGGRKKKSNARSKLVAKDDMPAPVTEDNAPAPAHHEEQTSKNDTEPVGMLTRSRAARIEQDTSTAANAEAGPSTDNTPHTAQDSQKPCKKRRKRNVVDDDVATEPAQEQKKKRKTGRR